MTVVELPLITFIAQIIFPALFWGSVVTAVLLLRSFCNFTRTGPRVREEIGQHYSRFALISLLRLCGWAFIISTVLALSGSIGWISLAVLSGYSETLIGHWVTSAISLGLICSYLFCHQLLHIPSSLQASAQFRFTRLLPLWKRLTPSRLDWARNLLLFFYAFLLLAATLQLAFSGQPAKALFLFTFLLSGFAFYYTFIRHRKAVARQPLHQHEYPNVLMIGSDTLRMDRIGNGRNLTPFLDSLINKGVLFTNCYTPLARTAPALASLFSGKWPHKHGIRTNYPTADQTHLQDSTLVELLNNAGYHSAAIGDWAAADLGKIQFGFNEHDLPKDQWNLKHLIRQGPAEIRLFLSLFTHNRFGKRFLPELFYLAGIPLTRHLTEQTKDFISRQADADKPFFLNLFTATTHVPFGSDYPYYTLFTDDDYQGESRFTMTKLATPEEIIAKQELGREAYDVDQILNLYDGCVRQFDDTVKEIYQHLERCDLAKKTLLVIYSDHGSDFFETGSWGQGNTLMGDDPSGRVPLLIVDPGRDMGQTITQTVRTIDFAPTLLDLLEIDMNIDADGVSLLPLFDEPNMPVELFAFQETGLWLGNIPGRHPDHLDYPNLIDLLDVPDKQNGMLTIKNCFTDQVILSKDRSIRNGRWKLIYIPTRSGIVFQLFDVFSDPNCTVEVSAQYPEIFGNLRRLLLAWINEDPLMARQIGNSETIC